MLSLKVCSFLGKKYTIYAKIESGYISETFVCKDHFCWQKIALLDDSDQQSERAISLHLRYIIYAVQCTFGHQSHKKQPLVNLRIHLFLPLCQTVL